MKDLERFFIRLCVISNEKKSCSHLTFGKCKVKGKSAETKKKGPYHYFRIFAQTESMSRHISGDLINILFILFSK